MKTVRIRVISEDESLDHIMGDGRSYSDFDGFTVVPRTLTSREGLTFEVSCELLYNSCELGDYYVSFAVKRDLPDNRPTTTVWATSKSVTVSATSLAMARTVWGLYLAVLNERSNTRGGKVTAEFLRLRANADSYNS